MENREATNIDPWVDEQIAQLDSPVHWKPDAQTALERLRRRGQTVAARRRATKWGAAAAGFATLAVLAFPTTRAATYRACIDACVAVWPALAAVPEDVSVGGGPANAEPQTAPAPPIENGSRARPGAAAPDFALPDASGNTLRLADFRGQVVLLNFWATWCQPCKIEMPWFVEFQREYEARGFTVIAVSLDEEGWDAVKPFVHELKPNFPVVVGNDELAQGFGGVRALPTTFLIDQEGMVRRQYTGLVSESNYTDAIEELLEAR